MDEIDFKQKANKKYEDPKFPGNIKVGVYPGCAVKVFRAEQREGYVSGAENQMTEFFQRNNGCIVADWRPVQDQDGTIAIVCFYTILLTEEQRDVLNVRTEVMEKLVQEQVDKMNADYENEMKRQVEEKRNQELLIVKGKKCEHDHGGIAKEREQLVKLKKLVKKEAPDLLKKIGEEETPA
jgi:hypothetical protein